MINRVVGLYVKGVNKLVNIEKELLTAPVAVLTIAAALLYDAVEKKKNKKK